MDKDSIGNRMKANYEDRYRFSLTRRTPVIMRLDGRAFHTLTRRMDKPFDEMFSDFMNKTAMFLCSEIQGAKCAYVQSDEISILITDFDTLTTDAWFDYNIQKMTSVSAGLASAYFTNRFFDGHARDADIAIFDSRVFNIPKEEVCNYFIWRQLDWMRNSVQMLAQAHFSHKQLQGKNQQAMHEMRKADPGVKAIATSGYSEDPVIADPSAFGFSGALRKPYSIEELSAVLENVLSKPS